MLIWLIKPQFIVFSISLHNFHSCFEITLNVFCHPPPPPHHHHNAKSAIHENNGLIIGEQKKAIQNLYNPLLTEFRHVISLILFIIMRVLYFLLLNSCSITLIELTLRILSLLSSGSWHFREGGGEGASNMTWKPPLSAAIFLWLFFWQAR